MTYTAACMSLWGTFLVNDIPSRRTMLRSLTEQKTDLLKALSEGVFARHIWLSTYQKVYKMRLTI